MKGRYHEGQPRNAPIFEGAFPPGFMLAGFILSFSFFPANVFAGLLLDEPSGAEIKTNTVYVGAEHSFAKSWSVAGEYDLQLSKENITGSSTTDNIFSVALRYSY